MSAIVAIPARLESTRFPRKVLADLHGKPMLQHVYDGVSGARCIDQVWVMTDSQEVMQVASSWGGKVLMTPSDCPTGTDRIAWAAGSLDADIVVNVQADEPLITGAVVDAIVEGLEAGDADVATPIYPIITLDELTNPNVVKVVRAPNGRALYFSRSPVPHVRDLPQSQWLSVASFWGHVGVYAYRRSVLLEYAQLPQGDLEQVEKLEQLRLLEAGKKIVAVPIDYRPHAVDVPADLEEVKELMMKGMATQHGG